MPGPNLFQIRRTSVADREANTITLPNVGEVGVNLTDGRMWVANSTNVFEIGANTKNCRVSNTFFIGSSSVNTAANSTQITTDIAQLGTAVYVGANVDLTTVGLIVGNTTVNLIANSTIIKLANSTVNTFLSVPTAGQYSATNYFLHANGSWVQVTGGGSGSVRVYQAYTATASQTTFTVAGGYTVGQIDVFLNGVKLAEDEYTQNGSTVVLDVGAIVGTVVEVAGWISISSFSPTASGSDTQVQFNQSGSFGGSAGFTFDLTTNNVSITNTAIIGGAINANGTIGSGGDVLKSDGTKSYWGTVSGGSVGGANTNVLFNDSTAANGVAGFTFNKDTNNAVLANTLTVGSATVNSTNYSQTANNALNLGGTIASSYQLNSTLAANVATMTANNTLYLGGTLAADYQTEAGLAANVATLDANTAKFLIGANVVSNTTGLYPLSNTSGAVLGNTIARWVITANSATFSGAVNAATHSVGTAWTANSTLVNANALNCVNQINTATLFVATTIDVGANVDLSTTQLFVGNSTTNTTLGNNYIDIGNTVVNVYANSTLVKVTNSTANSIVTPASFFTGNSIANMIANSVTITVANSTGFSQINPSYMYNGNGATQALQSGGTGFWYGNNTTNVTSGTVTPTTPYLQVANSTGSANLTPAGLVTGTSVVNGTVIVSGGSLISANIQVNSQTTNYTLVAGDSGKLVSVSNTSAVTITVPAGLPIGYRVQVLRANTSTVTMSNTGQTGALLFSRTGAFAITAQWGSASISQPSANVYVIDGSV